MSKYDHLEKDALIRLLDRRDAEQPLGLVWERPTDAGGELDPEAVLNRDFVALDLDESLSHGDAPWQNMIIEGDNYDALRALRLSHKGAIRCIYIDPPYNTGNRDFVYNDRFVEKSHRFRHSLWLEFMHTRLQLAKELLANDGVIFVSIDDNELFRLGMLMDRVFGEENKLGVMVWKNVTDNNPSRVVTEHEYLLFYARDKSAVPAEWKSSDFAKKEAMLAVESELLDEHEDVSELQKTYTEWFRGNKEQLKPLDNYKYIDRDGIYAGSRSVHNPGKEGYRYDVMHPDTGFPCAQPLMGYRFPETTMGQLLSDKKILFGKDHSKLIELKVYLKDYKSKLSSVVDLDGRSGSNVLRDVFDNEKIFNNPKSVELMSWLMSYFVAKTDLVLDFFAGSGTTAHAVAKLNAEDRGTRKFILVSSTEATEDNPDKNLCRDVCAQRVRKVLGGYTNAKGQEVAGLGGGFAYLRTRRIPRHRLNRRLGHVETWHALQLMHGLPLDAWRGRGFVASAQAGVAIAYLPDIDDAALAALEAWLVGTEGPRPSVYCWAPERLQAFASRIEALPIPQTLAERFGR